jgi:hypothetical protein
MIFRKSKKVRRQSKKQKNTSKQNKKQRGGRPPIDVDVLLDKMYNWFWIVFLHFLIF